MFNLIWNNRKISVRDAKDLRQGTQVFSQVMPLWMRLPNDSWWYIPYEPLISVSGTNVVKMRNVSKQTGKGTIKERWSQGDMRINVEGTFVNDTEAEYTESEVQTLLEIITQKEPIQVQNEFFQLLGINQIVVLSYNLPFTTGENVQNWSFEAVSDDSYNLFYELE